MGDKIRRDERSKRTRASADSERLVCPVCGSELVQEKCKVVCRSKTCVYRIIYNCSEF